MARGETLIAGATGTIASPLTKDLLEDGVKVRGLVRSRDKAVAVFGGDVPDLELVVGAFDDDDVLDKALQGVELAFLALGSSPQQVQLEKTFIDAAAPSIAQADRWFGSAPTGRTAFIDTRDVSEAAAAVITRPALQNTTHVLTGPEALTNVEVAEVLSRVLGREIRYVPIDEDAVRKGITGAGLPDLIADIAIGINRAVEAGAQDKLTNEVEAITGHAPRTLEQFVRDHRDAFTG